LRLAIVQPLMQWSGDANAATVVHALALAADAGAQVGVFPELAIPGFHRGIATLAKPHLVDGWLRAVQQACARHRIAATLGVPTFAGGTIRNSQIFIDESGCCVGAVHKRGLTDPEATFFARGDGRPVLAFGGRRCSAVICREVEDGDEVHAELEPHAPEVVFWPGLMSPEAGTEHIDPPRHVQHAQQFARRLGAFVVQANWPNSLNYPEQGAETGHSAVIAPDGALLFRLPKASAGIGCFDLGAAHCEWLALSDRPASQALRAPQ
jgi:predicted amidohydrolase